MSFFFSSRRRHTRFDCDWSSDVCSSDLFRNPPDGAVVVQDLVHGTVTFQNAELDDLIIARSDSTPTYNFCVVVDDMDMGVTHVRSEEHTSELQSQSNLVCRLLLEKKKPNNTDN